MKEAPGAPQTKTPRALLLPSVDLLLTGGASLIVLAVILAMGIHPLNRFDLGTLVVFGILINWPHFIASYRLLYATNERVQRHRAASIYVPAVLGLYSVYAVVMVSDQPVHTQLLILAGSIYLARHYTGQVWGMMASFAYIEGMSFAPEERRLVRVGLALIMFWHVAWAANLSIYRVSPALVEPARRLYEVAGWVAVTGFLVGMVGLGRMARRTGRIPPARVLVPWLSIHVWYLAMARDPTTLLLVQIAHALQYLAFPLRIELNNQAPSARFAWRRAGWHLAGWILVGLAVFEGAEPLFRACYELAGGQGPLPGLVSGVLISAIAIHHYFIDGALYKLRNPEVRRALFAHLEPR